MIQRVQSIYLVLVKLFALLFLFLPLGAITYGDESIYISLANMNISELTKTHLESQWLRYAVIAIAILAMVISLLTVLNYKKRLKQLRFNQMNLLLHILMVALTFFYIDNIRGYLSNATADTYFRYGVAIIFPLISLLLILMASRAIRKDENLVRSADRLR